MVLSVKAKTRYMEGIWGKCSRQRERIQYPESRVILQLLRNCKKTFGPGVRKGEGSRQSKE
jgi:hypothetical protein